ncbi:GNAT family N-acetyltransferase [Alkalibacillus salilacus]|uniref:GNAT superfamily N-acetyltransferase n=1 Tax=Alkalibacillus salilacus TaxID=284582 RepID=A0ABT9VIZ5_9BACI|nr:GNAT family N-acetyltransferase [Alkalibacillus salilacus]MDQ0160770.1 GNAT superfamily N-acetyltransferase [Alkalibacillus salilacus]
MHIEVKKYQDEDEPQLIRLLNFCFEYENLINIVKSNQLNVAFSAYFENDLVGILLTWKSRIHPYCLYFRILVDPFYRHLNIETQLLLKLEEIKEEGLTLQTSTWETSNKQINLYLHNGFKEIRRTYISALAVSDVINDRSLKGKGVQIQTLEEVLMNKELTEALIHQVKTVYEETHEVNPVAHLDADQWYELIVSNDVLQDWSYIYIDSEEKSIIAYSFLHESDEIKTVELGWCGTNGMEQKQLIPELVHMQVNYAYRHGFEFIIGEFDTTDSYALEVLTRFPFAPSPTWITFQKE